MISETIPLRFAGPTRVARLRELTGRDEFRVSGVSTSSAVDLLSALMDNTAAAGSSELRTLDLVASDRDRLLAAVYERAFGDRIESTLTCVKCKQPFDLDFSLRGLIEAVNQRSGNTDWTYSASGRFENSKGQWFCLPTSGDEIKLCGMSAGEAEMSLLELCTGQGEWDGDRETFEGLLETVAPLLDMELTAKCVECNQVQTVHFDIQTFLLGAIVTERRRLLNEINRIARAYAWPLDEILSLRRTDRRYLVELIENEYVT
jgi:hypothetical protein